MRELKSPLAGSVNGYRAFQSISFPEISYPRSLITSVTEPLLVVNTRLKESSAWWGSYLTSRWCGGFLSDFQTIWIQLYQSLIPVELTSSGNDLGAPAHDSDLAGAVGTNTPIPQPPPPSHRVGDGLPRSPGWHLGRCSGEGKLPKFALKGRGSVCVGGWGEGGQLARQDSWSEVNHKHLHASCCYKYDTRR